MDSGRSSPPPQGRKRQASPRRSRRDSGQKPLYSGKKNEHLPRMTAPEFRTPGTVSRSDVRNTSVTELEGRKKVFEGMKSQETGPAPPQTVKKVSFESPHSSLVSCSFSRILIIVIDSSACESIAQAVDPPSTTCSPSRINRRSELGSHPDRLIADSRCSHLDIDAWARREPYPLSNSSGPRLSGLQFRRARTDPETSKVYRFNFVNVRQVGKHRQGKELGDAASGEARGEGDRAGKLRSTAGEKARRSEACRGKSSDSR